MQLGFVSALLDDASLETVLSTAAEFNYDCVELMCWPAGKADRRYAGVTHIDVSEFSDAQAHHVLQMCDRYGIRISGLGYYPNPLSADTDQAERAISQIRRVIQAAAALGVRQMNTFVGRDWTKSIDENWPRFIETWVPLVEFATQHDVRIGIENCPMYFTLDEWPGGKNLAVSPAVWRRMFEAIPNPNFGLNYDPSHLVWQQMDYLAPLSKFADRIFHVHVKDVQIDRQRLNDVGILATPLEYHTPKLPGQGDIDWKPFFATLADVGYQGPVCVEVEDRDYEVSPESKRQALSQACKFLRKYIPEGQG